MSYNRDWSWKPPADQADKWLTTRQMKQKSKSRKKKNGKKKKLIYSFDNRKFYKSREWQELRVRVLEKYDCKCMMCGRSPKDHGVVLNVDHIKPRSKYPELSLCFENLQILCGACNRGKLNKYETDYRPDQQYIEEHLDRELLSTSPI